MCGQFNEQIATWALDEMENMGVEVDRRIIAIGVRAVARLEDAGQPVEDLYRSRLGRRHHAPVQDVLMQDRSTGPPGKPSTRSSFSTTSPRRALPTARTPCSLLPVDLERLQRLEQRPWPSRVLPTFSMDWDRLFSALVRQYLFVSLYRAFVESLASENASRLASMRAAEKNIRTPRRSEHPFSPASPECDHRRVAGHRIGL
jgi:F-type H+-transporting ATPase subunit gamma